MYPISIRLELEVFGDSLSGRAMDDADGRRDFEGWLGLVAAIDALLPATAAPPRTVVVEPGRSDSSGKGMP